MIWSKCGSLSSLTNLRLRLRSGSCSRLHSCIRLHLTPVDSFLSFCYWAFSAHLDESDRRGVMCFDAGTLASLRVLYSIISSKYALSACSYIL